MLTGVIAAGRVKVALLERELWTEFSKLGTEMIITKAGRSVGQNTRYNLSGNCNNHDLSFLLALGTDFLAQYYPGGQAVDGW